MDESDLSFDLTDEEEKLQARVAWYYYFGDLTQQQIGSSVMTKLGLTSPYEEYVAKYGKENADFILSTIQSWQDNYKQIAYIDMDFPVDEYYRGLAGDEAEQKKLSFDRIAGSLSLIHRLVTGQWDPAEFLVVPPGAKIVANDDGMILAAVP